MYVFLICAFTVLVVLLLFYIKAYFLLIKKPILKLYEKRKSDINYCLISNMPKRLLDLIVLFEDREFYKHKGLNYNAIKAAFKHNIKHKGAKIGGSSITQQLCKNLYFKFEGTIARKICEAIITLKMEKVLDKRQILELYLNVIYFDNGQYGIVDAAKFYFNKNVCDLTINEIYILVVMLPVVGIYNILNVPKSFCEYKNQKAKNHNGDFTKEEYNIIFEHTADNLDEDLIKINTEAYKKYSLGPMINEKYGIGSMWQKNL